MWKYCQLRLILIVNFPLVSTDNLVGSFLLPNFLPESAVAKFGMKALLYCVHHYTQVLLNGFQDNSTTCLVHEF